MTTHTHPGPSPTWWGEIDVPMHTAAHGQIGPLKLWVQRRPDLWQISTISDKDPLLADVHRLAATTDLGPDDDADVTQIALQDQSTVIRLSPASANRALVTRPAAPFVVPAGGRARLFVGAPLWLQVRHGAQAALLDCPIHRPSDTWFGPPTNAGELCYSSKTHCRMRIEEVPIRPHRSVTAVTVLNRTDEELRLDRLKIPVQALAIYHAADGRLWTQDVMMQRNEVGEHAEVSVRRAEPTLALEPTLVAPARVVGSSNAVVRAFSTLFS